MFRVAIVEDEESMAESLKDYVNRELQKTGMEAGIDVFSCGRHLLYELEDGKKYELYLMDIELPDIQGIELARQMRNYSKEAYLIYITSHTEFAVDGYEQKAFRFIPKDQIEERLGKALRELASQEDRGMSWYVIEKSSGCEKIAYRDIVYLYKDRKNVVFVTTHRNISERITLSQVYEKLNSEEFLFLDRSYLVNLRHVMKIQSSEVYLRDGTTLYVSRYHVQEVKERIQKYWQKNL